ncbi:hypothetical protein JO972_12645 [Verrucomicrobiaceae bacterium 5K15]|uniref:Uncharacterized protein n=1 Tax=Oceaniferula flava TaxID=2800421 RepID=A0AAE2SCR3_9BACT|nr:hypothetical protein [Oceaniferula flavus]MBK1855811.1 hypothetical protein [Oceaniferula flavus]MBM1137118.1 hypothetical protein [Oceaniferula flavus]
MKLKPSLALIALGGFCALTSCKESSSSANEASGEQDTQAMEVDPMTAEHVLFNPAKLVMPAGTVIVDTESMSMKDCQLTVAVQGQKIQGMMTRTGMKQRTATFDSADQITVVVNQSTSKTSTVMNGQSQVQPQETAPLHGQTVILTKTGDSWSGALQSGEATEKQLKAIENMATALNGDGDSRHIYGTSPRKVGDSWEVDTAKLTFLSRVEGKTEGTFTVSFDDIEMYQGYQCALLTAKVDVTTPMGEGDMKVHLKGDFTIRRSLEHLVDLDNQMTGSMTMSGSINQGPGTMKVEGPMTVSQASELSFP